MQDENQQSVDNGITPENARASLGLSTSMLEQMFNQQNPTQPQQELMQSQEPQNAPQQEIDPKMISDIVKQAIKEELGGIKEEIAKVIEDDKNEKD